MKTALLIIDMVQDYFDHDYPITPMAEAIIGPVNDFTSVARQKGQPVVFATDSFLEGDFLFKGKMNPHSIRGTVGAEIVDLLNVEPTDMWLPKRRFSGFFKTDLDQTLRLWDVGQVAVCGIATHFCVLTTALDALALDFRAIIVEDCCAAHSKEAHDGCLDLYRHNPLDPLLRVMPWRDVAAEWD